MEAEEELCMCNYICTARLSERDRDMEIRKEREEYRREEADAVDDVVVKFGNLEGVQKNSVHLLSTVQIFW